MGPRHRVQCPYSPRSNRSIAASITRSVSFAISISETSRSVASVVGLQSVRRVCALVADAGDAEAQILFETLAAALEHPAQGQAVVAIHGLRYEAS